MTDVNKDVVQLVEQIREKTEKFGSDSAEVKSLVANHGEILEKQEKSNQEIVAKMGEERKAHADLVEQVKGLEVEIARKGSAGSENHKDLPEYKALNDLMSKGFAVMSLEEKALLRSDSDTQGGYLTDAETSSEIIKKITEISPIRQLARVRSVDRKTLEMPKRETIPTAYWEGETEAGQESVSTYGTETLTAKRLTHIARYTQDLILASGFDIESEISSDAAEAFAFAEGNAFTVGNGVNKPEGFLANASIIAGASETESSGTITGDDLITLTGALKVGYNPMYGFNRTTLALLRTLKGSDGHYLWQAGLGPQQPNTIAGESYAVIQDMPSVATGALSVIYGDFMRGYQIIDRTATTVKRDDLTEAANNIVKLIFHRYVHGQVVLPEAFKALKIKA